MLLSSHPRLIARGGGTGFSTGAIVGVSIACGVVTLVIAALGMWAWMRWKSQQPRAVTSLEVKEQTSAVSGVLALHSTVSLREGQDKPGLRSRPSVEQLGQASGDFRILQYEFEPKPKRVKKEGKHARRSVLRRATQEDSEEGHGHGGPSSHGHAAFELNTLHGPSDAASVNVREWTSSLKTSASHGQLGRHGYSHARAGSVDPFASSPRVGAVPLTSSRPTTPTPHGLSSLGAARERREPDPHPHGSEPTPISALSPATTANGYPLEKRRVAQNADAANTPYSPAPSPFSAGLSPDSAGGGSAYFSAVDSPYTMTSHSAVSPRPFGDEQRLRSASRTRDGHATPHSATALAPTFDLDGSPPAFLSSDPSHRGPTSWDDHTQRPGYDPKRGTVLPSYRSVVPGSSP